MGSLGAFGVPLGALWGAGRGLCGVPGGPWGLPGRAKECSSILCFFTKCCYALWALSRVGLGGSRRAVGVWSGVPGRLRGALGRLVGCRVGSLWSPWGFPGRSKERSTPQHAKNINLPLLPHTQCAQNTNLLFLHTRNARTVSFTFLHAPATHNALMQKNKIYVFVTLRTKT